MTKEELRKLYLEKRLSLSDAAYAQLNFNLYQQFFFSTDLSFVKVLHTFLPIVSRKEPDTWLIIDRLRREYPHIRISIPKVNTQANELESFYFEGLHQLTPNAWEILEPKKGVPTETDKIDLVLVPLLAFDKLGHRVGYGKGYYDKFLSHCNPACKKIGLSFFPPLQNILYEDFDIKLNGAITPHDYFNF